MRRALPLLTALGLVAAVVVPYLALGGASFEPTPVADPCASREWRDPGDVQEALEQIALSALDGAACELGVSREELVLAVRNEEALDAFADEQGISREDAELAVGCGAWALRPGRSGRDRTDAGLVRPLAVAGPGHQPGRVRAHAARRLDP